MYRKLFIGIRIFFGIFLLVFGFDHFFNYLPFPQMSPEANAYFAALLSTGVMQIVGLIEILAGIAFLVDRFGAIMSLFLMSVSVNAVLFHISLDPDKIIIALILFILNVLMLFYYEKQYKQILETRM